MALAGSPPTVRGGGTFVCNSEELVVIKRFGEPIYPTLTPVARLARGGDKPWHTLINADNFHALQLLLYCYEGQVDVIYIDPPYNTGARDWKYNNDYVDANDRWRHSKWLSMMKKRLLLAKQLLKPDGVLIIAIDDNEVHHLLMLLEQMMPERSITSVTIVHNPRGNITNNFAQTHEYALFVTMRGLSVVARTMRENSNPRKLRRWGHNSTRAARRTMFYPIYVKDGAIVRVGEQPADDFHPHSRNIHKDNGEIEVWPIDQNGIERRWNFGLDTIHDELDRIAAIEDEQAMVDLFLTEENTVPKTVWVDRELEAGKHGASLVKAITEVGFPYPKSLYTVKRCLDLITRYRPNALILDFFAGSGTTYHATCLLNAEDGGNRRCILVTNNEVEEKQAKRLMAEGHFPGDPEYDQHGICEAVTWPRCKFVTQGHRDDDTPLPGKYLDGREMSQGFAENVECFRLDFLDPNAVAYGREFAAILPILWLMAGARGEREDATADANWFLPAESPFAVLLRESSFAAFRHALEDHPEVNWVFLVTDSEEAYREMIAALPGKQTKQLYRSYLDNFKINTEASL